MATRRIYDDQRVQVEVTEADNSRADKVLITVYGTAYSRQEIEQLAEATGMPGWAVAERMIKEYFSRSDVVRVPDSTNEFVAWASQSLARMGEQRISRNLLSLRDLAADAVAVIHQWEAQRRLAQEK